MEIKHFFKISKNHAVISSLDIYLLNSYKVGTYLCFLNKLLEYLIILIIIP